MYTSQHFEKKYNIQTSNHSIFFEEVVKAIMQMWLQLSHI